MSLHASVLIGGGSAAFRERVPRRRCESAHKLDVRHLEQVKRRGGRGEESRAGTRNTYRDRLLELKRRRGKAVEILGGAIAQLGALTANRYRESSVIIVVLEG